MILKVIIEKSFLLSLLICVSKVAARSILAPNRAYRDIQIQEMFAAQAISRLLLTHLLRLTLKITQMEMFARISVTDPFL